MTNKDKINKALENASEDKIKEVLDFLGYKENRKFVPKHDETYYFITAIGAIDWHFWENGNKYDNHALLMGNVYETREEAEQALDFQIRKAKLIKEIEDSSDVIDWGDENQDKIHFWVDSCNNSLRLSCVVITQLQGTAYTTNRQFLEELIKERSDEVKELLFNIKVRKGE